MKPLCILDACALIAYLNDEQGADIVANYWRGLKEGSVFLLMHKINLLEVYYGFYKERGKTFADEMLYDVIDIGFHIVDHISDSVFLTVGRLKGTYHISLGDAILLAQAFLNGAAVLTCDHHEFDPIEKAEAIEFEWIR